MEWLRKVWVKGRWYILAGLAAIAVVLSVLLQTKNGGSVDKLLRRVFEGQKKLVKKEVDRKLAKEQEIDEEIKKVDQRLKEIEAKREETSQKVDTMDLKELADAWESLGM